MEYNLQQTKRIAGDIPTQRNVSCKMIIPCFCKLLGETHIALANELYLTYIWTKWNSVSYIQVHQHLTIPMWQDKLLWQHTFLGTSYLLRIAIYHSNLHFNEMIFQENILIFFLPFIISPDKWLEIEMDFKKYDFLLWSIQSHKSLIILNILMLPSVMDIQILIYCSLCNRSTSGV